MRSWSYYLALLRLYAALCHGRNALTLTLTLTLSLTLTLTLTLTLALTLTLTLLRLTRSKAISPSLNFDMSSTYSQFTVLFLFQ